MNAADTRDADDLWTFACAFYAQEPVKRCCLELQNRQGANVDLILWLCWLHARGIRLAPEALTAALTQVQGWRHQGLKALRALRARAAGPHPARQWLRRRLLALELIIEQQVLQRLADRTPHLPRARAAQPPLTLHHYLSRFPSVIATTADDLLAHLRSI